MPTPRPKQPSNAELLAAIHAHSLNGEVQEFRQMLPGLRVVAGLAPSVPALQKVAAHADVIVSSAVDKENRDTTWRTLGGWLKKPMNMIVTLIPLVAAVATIAYLVVNKHP